MSKKYIFRDAIKLSDRKHPYVVVSKAIVEDERLTPEDIGIMTVLLSNKDNWNQNVVALKVRLKISEKRLRKRLAHLKSLGYVQRNKHKALDGTWIWETIVIEDPEGGNTKPQSGNGPGGSPGSGSPVNGPGFNLISNILNKEEGIKNILTNKKELVNKEELLKPPGLKGISDRKSNTQSTENWGMDDQEEFPF